MTGIALIGGGKGVAVQEIATDSHTTVSVTVSGAGYLRTIGERPVDLM